MIITIDTSKDSSEEIRKAADFLKMLADGKGSSQKQAEFKASEEGTVAFGNLFGGDEQPKIVEVPKDKNIDDVPKIELY
jgi:hypothetical protein